MKVRKFSEYELHTLRIITQALSSVELEDLSIEELDRLQGQVLHWLIRSGYVEQKTVKSAYQVLLDLRSRHEKQF